MEEAVCSTWTSVAELANARQQRSREQQRAAMTEAQLAQERQARIDAEKRAKEALENLAKSVAIESGELLECFQWANAAPNDRIIDELADVLTYCYLLAAKLGVQPSEAVINKLQLTRSKYPVEEARGTSAKYTEL